MTVAPDEGMMLLQQRMHASDVTGQADAPAASAEVGGELGIMVRLAAAVEANTATMRAAARASQADWSACHLINITGGQTNAAGTLDDPDRFGPRAGFAWQIMGITVVLGAGATSFSIWEDSPLSPINIAFSSTVSGRWEPSDYFMQPGSRLVYTSVGGGITVGIGKAVEIALDALPGYLGLRVAGKR